MIIPGQLSSRCVGRAQGRTSTASLWTSRRSAHATVDCETDRSVRQTGGRVRQGVLGCRVPKLADRLFYGSGRDLRADILSHKGMAFAASTERNARGNRDGCCRDTPCIADAHSRHRSQPPECGGSGNVDWAEIGPT